MKIKRDFVTNSSSTSFILTLEAECNNVQELVKIINEYLSDYIEENKWNDNFEHPPSLNHDNLTQVGPNQFTLKEYIPFYSNEEDDLLGHISGILISTPNQKLKKYKINMVSPIKCDT